MEFYPTQPIKIGNYEWEVRLIINNKTIYLLRKHGNMTCMFVCTIEDLKKTIKLKEK